MKNVLSDVDICTPNQSSQKKNIRNDLVTSADPKSNIGLS